MNNRLARCTPVRPSSTFSRGTETLATGIPPNYPGVPQDPSGSMSADGSSCGERFRPGHARSPHHVRSRQQVFLRPMGRSRSLYLT